MYSKKDRSTLETQIDSLLADNTSQDISAQDVRTPLGDANLSYEHLDEGSRDLSLEANIKFDWMKGNHYNLIGSARTGIINISMTSALRGGFALIRHNDATLPSLNILSSAGGSFIYPTPGVSALSDFYTTGSDNYILLLCVDTTVDAEVIAVIQYAAGSQTPSGDNLGNHTATQALDMGTNPITNVGNVDGRDVSADGTKLDTINTATVVGSGTDLSVSNAITGTRYGSRNTPDTNTSFTVNEGAAVEGGYFNIYSQASTIPTITSTATIYDEELAANYTVDETNLIQGVWHDGELEIYVRTLTASPSGGGTAIVDDPDVVLYVSSDDINGNGDGNTGISDQQDISTMHDQTSPDIDMGLGIAPKFNLGDTSIEFDRTAFEHLKNLATGVTARPWCVIVVFTPLAGISDNDGIWGADDASNNPFLKWETSPSGGVTFFGGTTFSSHYPMTEGDKHIITVNALSSGNTEIYLDGESSPSYVSADPGTAGLNNKLILGGILDSGTAFFRKHEIV